MKYLVSKYIVILLVGFTIVDVHADINDEELTAFLGTLIAAEARTMDEDSCSVKNVALHKPAKASSIFSDLSVHAVASLAVDGNPEQRWHGNGEYPKIYCFATLDTPHANNWWYVDLQQTYILEKVTFYNRIDCCGERASNFQILVGDTLDELTEVGFVETMGSTKTVTLPPNTRGRFVKLVQAKTAVFHMCEVEVYGIPATCQKPNRCRNGGIEHLDPSKELGYNCECKEFIDYMFRGTHCDDSWIKVPKELEKALSSSP